MPPGMGYTEPMQALAGAGNGDMTKTKMQEMADSLPPDRWEAIRGYLETLPEDEREQWFADFTAGHGAGRIDAQDAMTRADSLRVDQPGVNRDPGGFTVAASPLAHIGAGMQNYQAQKQFKQGQADLAKANEGMARQLETGARAMVGPLGQPAGQPAGPTSGPAGRGAAPGGGMAGAIRSLAGSGPGRGAAPGGMTPEMLQQLMMQNRGR